MKWGSRLARRRYRGKKRRTSRSSFYLGLMLIAAGVWWVVTTLFPNQTYTVPDWRGMDKPIFVQGELKEYPALGSGEELLLPITVIQESVGCQHPLRAGNGIDYYHDFRIGFSHENG
ncbi:Uncharacterised protein [Actinobacillus pleuropneumoniae]|nr:Uncharacterised protein [Actinobacillus pleuropneumoniae]